MDRLPPLLMLHGSRGTHQELWPLASALVHRCNPVLVDMLGHGGRDIPSHFSVKAMAEDIVGQLDAKGVSPLYCFGYSFGGYVALYLARHFPQRILGVCTLATKFCFDAQTVALWSRLSDIARIRRLQSAIMDQRHPGQDWERLVKGLADLYQQLATAPELTEDDLSGITVPALVIASDRDQIVPWAESLMLTYRIPRSQGFTFTGQAHPLSVIPVPFLASVIGGWLDHQQRGRAPD